ncbi:hypothetical protein RF11_09695 [Thelohanellus kitauei]|uniref:Uncharacterized protein n=1 Tax=Thelohanellus kitauei TaxID=669202 RepID=A0A0C2N923_THEKT|nr:hypothetical protein RF11_09695 [Thelohanellus kitauei]
METDQYLPDAEYIPEPTYIPGPHAERIHYFPSHEPHIDSSSFMAQNAPLIFVLVLVGVALVVLLILFISSRERFNRTFRRKGTGAEDNEGCTNGAGLQNDALLPDSKDVQKYTGSFDPKSKK